VPAEVTENISRSGVDLGQSDLKDLWAESVRLASLPRPGYTVYSKDSTITTSFAGEFASSREVSASNLDELLSMSQVPDEATDLTIQHRIMFKPDEGKVSFQTRSLSVSVSDIGDKARIHAEGDRDWVALVSAQLPQVLYRRKRNVFPQRVALTLGFTIPIAAALFYSASKLQQLSGGVVAIVLVLAGTLTLGTGSLAIYWNTDKLLPASRVAFRGEPRDPPILRILWEIASGIIITVVAGAVLTSIGFPL
jgi:hypothetical protein